VDSSNSSKVVVLEEPNSSSNRLEAWEESVLSNSNNRPAPVA